MHRQRFPKYRASSTHPILPTPLPAVQAAGFCLLDASMGLPTPTLDQLVCRHWIYRAAFEEAWAVLRPSLPERDLLGGRN